MGERSIEKCKRSKDKMCWVGTTDISVRLMMLGPCVMDAGSPTVKDQVSQH